MVPAQTVPLACRPTGRATAPGHGGPAGADGDTGTVVVVVVVVVEVVVEVGVVVDVVVDVVGGGGTEEVVLVAGAVVVVVVGAVAGAAEAGKPQSADAQSVGVAAWTNR